MKIMRRFGRLLLGLSVVLAACDASAQTAACVELCRIPCVKPISIADRWDDESGIPGYMGEPVRRPEWRNNGRYDQEDFADVNANGLYDVGESFVDDNGNAVFDQELYDPVITGYGSPADLGLVLSLHPGDPSVPSTPGQFYSIMLPPTNKGTPDPTWDGYRSAWSGCEPTAVEPGDRLSLFPGLTVGPTNQAMRDLIAADPNATWDEATQQVLESEFALSPRVLFVPAHDPRIPAASGQPSLVARKILAFFEEQMTGSAIVRGRLLRVQAAGESCGGGSAGGFILDCPVPAPAASWGQVKATYR